MTKFPSSRFMMSSILVQWKWGVLIFIHDHDFLCVALPMRITLFEIPVANREEDQTPFRKIPSTKIC
jgi:hypothetical protein